MPDSPCWLAARPNIVRHRVLTGPFGASEFEAALMIFGLGFFLGTMMTLLVGTFFRWWSM